MPKLPPKDREARHGYLLPSQPAKPIPELPWDLGDLGDRVLMRLYSEFTQWANFLNVQVATAEAEEEDLEAALKFTEATFMAARSADGVGLNDARALRDIDEGIQEARTAWKTARHVRKLTDTLYGNCERSAAACSRELTRRTAMGPHERRSD